MGTHTVKNIVEWVGLAIDIIGVLVLLAGVLVAGGRYLSVGPAGWRDHDNFRAFRTTLGRAILLGLEVLIAGDIIRTVAIEPTMDRVLVLAVIVLVRTFLSFSLQIELDRRMPWSKGDASRSA